MGAGHSHTRQGHADPTPRALAARKRANLILAAVLIPLTLLTLVAMALLWPSGSKEGITLASPYAAAPGVTFDTGKIQRVVTGSCTQPRNRGRSALLRSRTRTRAGTPSRSSSTPTSPNPTG